MADTKPPKEWRPIYVQYVASRLCRYNPSYKRAIHLHGHTLESLWEKWEARHPRRTRPEDIAIDRPKKRKR